MTELSQLLLQAQQHHQTGQLEQAEILYSKILKQDPDNTDASYLLGMLAYQTGRYSLAADMVTGVIHSKPNVPQYHCDLARVFVSLEQKEDAIQSYQKAIELQPDLEEACYNLGLLFRQTGNVDGAIDCLKKAIELKPDFYLFYNALGNAYRDKGLLEEASDQFATAISLNPEHALSHYNLAAVLGSNHRYDDAIKHYNHAIKLSPDLSMAHKGLADILFNTKKYEQALNSYQQALENNKNYVDAMLGAANSARELQNLDLAREMYEQALSIEPGQLPVLLNYAFHLELINELETAETIFKKVVSIEPAYTEAIISLANIQIKLNRIDEAIRTYTTAKQLIPDSPEICCKLGDIYRERKDHTTATKLFNESLAIDPEFVPALGSMAYLKEKLSQLDEAEEYALRGLDLKPDSHQLNLIMARIMRRRNRFPEASEFLVKLLDLDPKADMATDANHLLGQVYDKMGEPDKAYNFFVAGNKLAESGYLGQDIDKNSYLDSLDKLEGLYSNKLSTCTSPPVNYPNGNPPIFILGFPRSGTTLLDQILNSHKHIETIEEQPTVLSMQHSLFNVTDNRNDPLVSLTDKEIGDLRNIYFSAIEHFAGDSTSGHIIDKMPLNTPRAHLIWRIFPEASFILSIRHPCDVCLSCFMQNFGPNPAMANFFSLKETALLYKKVMNSWIKYAENLPIHYHMIRYEDLIHNVEDSAKKLLNFLDVEWDPDVLKHTEIAKQRGIINTPSYHQVTQPIYYDAEYRWKRYEKQFEPIIDILAPFIDYFGYSDTPSNSIS